VNSRTSECATCSACSLRPGDPRMTRSTTKTTKRADSRGKKTAQGRTPVKLLIAMTGAGRFAWRPGARASGARRGCVGSPEPVLLGHPSNESDGLGEIFDRCRLGLPAPEETESLAMPAQDGFWFHEKYGVSPVRHETRQQHQKPALVDGKSVALGCTSS